MKHDTRLKSCITHVEACLQVYQRDARLNPTLPFPLEPQHEEIGVVIDKHSKNYIVGENATAPANLFNAEALNGLAQRVTDTFIIRMMCNNRHHKLSLNRSTNYDNSNDKGVKAYTKDSTTSFKA